MAPRDFHPVSFRLDPDVRNQLDRILWYMRNKMRMKASYSSLVNLAVAEWVERWRDANDKKDGRTREARLAAASPTSGQGKPEVEQ